MKKFIKDFSAWWNTPIAEYKAFKEYQKYVDDRVEGYRAGLQEQLAGKRSPEPVVSVAYKAGQRDAQREPERTVRRVAGQDYEKAKDRAPTGREAAAAFVRDRFVPDKTEALNGRGTVMLIATVFAAALILGPTFMPWPAGNAYLVLLRVRDLGIYRALEWAYYLMWGSSASLCYVVIGQIVERLRPRSLKRAEDKPGKVPALLPPERREKLEVALGTVYDPKRLGVPSARPTLAIVPELGLYTGLLVFASTGWGKTRHTLLPVANQVFAYRREDPERRIGGLVLEVKGTLCDSILDILREHGREKDYIVLEPGGAVKYNPIDPGMSPSAIASTINTLMINLYGEDRDKYWSQVGGEAIKNIVGLCRFLQNGHCTLHDIMLCITDADFLAERIKVATEQSEGKTEETLCVSLDVPNPGRVERQGFVIEQGELRAPLTKALHDWLIAEKIPYDVDIDMGHKKNPRGGSMASIKRWHYNWLKIRAETRSAISSGMTPFLTIFDDDPELMETFCPAPDAEGLFGGWEDAIESGKVVACKFDRITDADMSRLLGVLIKQAAERAMLRRIPRMHRAPHKYYRQWVLLVDECHELLTVGEAGFGDDKFLAQSREARCIVLFATQSKTSLEASIRSKKGPDVILGNMKTKVFGQLEDLASAEYASKMCGDWEQWVPHVSMGESGQRSAVSLLGKGTVADQSSVSANKGYNQQIKPVFRPNMFLNELRNGQAIVRIYDGDQTRTMVTYMTPDSVPFEVN